MGAKPQHQLAYRRLCGRLRDWREQAGLTQRSLAQRLRRPHSFVYKVETGNRRIDPIELAQWAKACDVAANDVLAAMDMSR